MPVRLLDVETFRLVDGSEITEYAIVSHRWGDQEVLFSDLDGAGDSEGRIMRAKAGWAKVEGACNQARCDKLKYIWMDNCCIDKSSSAELTEELNSMYRYYQQANICYGYLEGLPDRKNPRFVDELAKHDWFTRGWTLQELIAPHEFVFFTDRRLATGVIDKTHWVSLGRRDTMLDDISVITGINVDVLNHTKDVHSVSVAKRMSWAARRKTTKVEDRAYCLMGLFNVNMPPIPGEGEKAFIRLQEEIMKESSDESLFAWRDPTANTTATYGLLAKSPEMFRESGHFGYYDWEPRAPYFKTNYGLRITLPLKLLGGDFAMAALNCPAPDRMDGFAGILLQRVTNYDSFDKTKLYEQYSRVEVGSIFPLDTFEERGSISTIYVRSSPPPPAVYPNNVLQLNNGPPRTSGYSLFSTAGVTPQIILRDTSWYWISPELSSAFKHYQERGRLTAMLAFSRPDHTMFTVLLGSMNDVGDVGFVVEDGWEDIPLEEWRERFKWVEPHPSGTSVSLPLESVCVEVTEQTVQKSKSHIASFVISPKPRTLGNAMLSETRPLVRQSESKLETKGKGKGVRAKFIKG